MHGMSGGEMGEPDDGDVLELWKEGVGGDAKH